MCQRRRGGRCIQSIVLAINIDGQIKGTPEALTATEHHTLNSVPRKKSTKLEQIQASELSNYWTESTRILYLEGVGFSLGKSPLQLAVLVPLCKRNHNSSASARFDPLFHRRRDPLWFLSPRRRRQRERTPGYSRCSRARLPHLRRRQWRHNRTGTPSPPPPPRQCSRVQVRGLSLSGGARVGRPEVAGGRRKMVVVFRGVLFSLAQQGGGQVVRTRGSVGGQVVLVTCCS